MYLNKNTMMDEEKNEITTSCVTFISKIPSETIEIPLKVQKGKSFRILSYLCYIIMFPHFVVRDFKTEFQLKFPSLVSKPPSPE